MKNWLPWKKRGGAREGSERKQLSEGKRAFTYGKFSLSLTVYQRCITLKTLQKITSDGEFKAYLVDVAEAFDKTSQSRYLALTRALAITPIVQTAYTCMYIYY